ncbi:MAG: hypothetical protein H7317_10445 [Pseudorhodobacter sp.]|nr:hypothetical protein [Pseudorhodobacter sp.]
MVFLEVLVIWFVVTTLVYLAVAIYSRSVRRERLEKEFDATDPQGGDVAGDRETYVRDGLAEYQQGLRRRLIGLIYVVPVVFFAVVVYFVNYR